MRYLLLLMFLAPLPLYDPPRPLLVAGSQIDVFGDRIRIISINGDKLIIHSLVDPHLGPEAISLSKFTEYFERSEQIRRTAPRVNEP